MCGLFKTANVILRLYMLVMYENEQKEDATANVIKSTQAFNNYTPFYANGICFCVDLHYKLPGTSQADHQSYLPSELHKTTSFS